MKLNKKNIPLFLIFLLFGSIIGSLLWEVFERIIHLIPGFSGFTLTMENPFILLDLYVISLGLRANPGTFLGLSGGIILFFRT